ncbi:uncharacterized protein LOC132304431 [Cornus florida]|uniref:uncharacterized protein LOC132304431 n=1 Tax=Cornus florida TaxID=4283 RepID=UPI002898226B|nr:uncharacterized protein LOC132304431 [Cornus florida]
MLALTAGMLTTPPPARSVWIPLHPWSRFVDVADRFVNEDGFWGWWKVRTERKAADRLGWVLGMGYAADRFADEDGFSARSIFGGDGGSGLIYVVVDVGMEMVAVVWDRWWWM